MKNNRWPLIIVLAITFVVLGFAGYATMTGEAPTVTGQATDRNVPGATTGPGRSSLRD
jgi:hypothetical protein